MSTSSPFVKRLEDKVFQQIKSKDVGYLLGAGASFLGGDGYPLANQLWEHIATHIPSDEGADIQGKLDGGSEGLEEALDLLDPGLPTEEPHRSSVTGAIAQHFQTITPHMYLY